MDLSRYGQDAVNMTSMHLMNMKSKRFQTLTKEWRHYQALNGFPYNETTFTVRDFICALQVFGVGFFFSAFVCFRLFLNFWLVKSKTEDGLKC